MAALLGIPPFPPRPTEGLGLNPGSGTCWVETAAPGHLSEPQFPTA